MDFKEIFSVSGKPGLFKTIGQTKSGVIIESLADGKRLQAFASDKISSLGEISIFTSGDDMPLREVFRLMQEKLGDQSAPGAKVDDKTLKTFFESIVPDFDHDRFYISHMRKITAWYNQLITAGMDDFAAPAEETESPGDTEVKSEEN